MHEFTNRELVNAAYRMCYNIIAVVYQEVLSAMDPFHSRGGGGGGVVIPKKKQGGVFYGK